MDKLLTNDLSDDKVILNKMINLIEKRQKYFNDFCLGEHRNRNFYKLLNDKFLNEINKLRNILLSRWESKLDDDIDNNDIESIASEHYLDFYDHLNIKYDKELDY